MDFVVSKVAMAICALMVAGILSGIFANDSLFRTDDELDSILMDLCALADQIGLSGVEAAVSWTVPFTSDGKTISVELKDFTVRAVAGSDVRVDQPGCRIRTWTHSGDVLNTSALESLDREQPVLKVRSSQTIDLTSRTMTVDGQQKGFVFAQVDP